MPLLIPASTLVVAYRVYYIRYVYYNKVILAYICEFTLSSKKYAYYMK